MATSINSGNIGRIIAALIAAGEAARKGPKLTTREEYVRQEVRKARIFTSALDITEMSVETQDSGTADCMNMAAAALTVPLIEIMGQLGSYGHVPQELRQQVAALLDDFAMQAPVLAQSIASKLRSQQAAA